MCTPGGVSNKKSVATSASNKLGEITGFCNSILDVGHCLCLLLLQQSASHGVILRKNDGRANANGWIPVAVVTDAVLSEVCMYERTIVG